MRALAFFRINQSLRGSLSNRACWSRPAIKLRDTPSVSLLEPPGYYQLLAAEDCSMVLGQLTFWLPPKLTSIPSGSKSSMPPLLLKKPSLPKKPRSRKPSLVPEPEPSCTNEEPFWKLPVLPNCIAGVHWLAKSPLLETRNPI